MRSALVGTTVYYIGMDYNVGELLIDRIGIIDRPDILMRLLTLEEVICVRDMFREMNLSNMNVMKPPNHDGFLVQGF